MSQHELKTLVLETAHAYRQGLEGKGGSLLVATTDRLSLALASGELSLDASVLNALIPEIIASQTRGDYTYLADLLEYRLLVLIS